MMLLSYSSSQIAKVKFPERIFVDRDITASSFAWPTQAPVQRRRRRSSSAGPDPAAQPLLPRFLRAVYLHTAGVLPAGPRDLGLHAGFAAVCPLMSLQDQSRSTGLCRGPPGMSLSANSACSPLQDIIFSIPTHQLESLEVCYA
jgi:hypothetical protein